MGKNVTYEELYNALKNVLLDTETKTIKNDAMTELVRFAYHPNLDYDLFRESYSFIPGYIVDAETVQRNENYKFFFAVPDRAIDKENDIKINLADCAQVVNINGVSYFFLIVPNYVYNDTMLVMRYYHKFIQLCINSIMTKPGQDAVNLYASDKMVYSVYEEYGNMNGILNDENFHKAFRKNIFTNNRVKDYELRNNALELLDASPHGYSIATLFDSLRITEFIRTPEKDKGL